MIETLPKTWTAWIGDSNPWWIAIGVGYGLLCIAVLILARMRWVQTRRFSACVILSVLAHGLLVGALGLMKLFDQPGAPAGDDGIRVTLTADAFLVEDQAEQVHSPHNTPDLPPEYAADPSPAPVDADPVDEPSLDEEPPTDQADAEPEALAADILPEPAAEDVVPTSDADVAPDGGDPAAEQMSVADDPPPSREDDATAAVSDDAWEPQPESTTVAENTEPDTPAAVTNESVTDESVTDERVVDEPAALAEEAPFAADAPAADDAWEPAEAVEPEPERVAEEPPQELFAGADTTVPSPPLGPESEAGFVPILPVSPAPTTTPEPVATSQMPAPPAAPAHPAGAAATSSRYVLRAAGASSQLAQRRGATPETEAAVRAALKWLADNQNPDGRWDSSRFGGGQAGTVEGHFRGGAGAEADTGVTGLALLALLASGNTHAAGEHRESVQHGLEFLMRSQRSDGDLAGGARHYARMYCHGMAALALCEAYGMTHDERLQPFAEDAVRYIGRMQHPVSGGWRYAAGESGDMSQFGWQVMALLAAKRAGLAVPDQQLALAERFLRSVSRGEHGGLACYRPGEQIKVSMTAEALAIRTLMASDNAPETLAEAAELLERFKPDQGRANLYYWYYGTLGLCQLGGPPWEQWNQALQHRLLPLQRQDGPYQGSWDVNTMWGTHGGRVYTTAMAALCLEVYYRYE